MHRCLLVTAVVIIQLASPLSSYEQHRFQQPFSFPEWSSSEQEIDDPADDFPRSRHKLLNLLRLLPASDDDDAALLPDLGLRDSDREKLAKMVQESDDGNLHFDFDKIATKKDAKGTAEAENDDDEDDSMIFWSPGAKRKTSGSATPTTKLNAGQKYYNGFGFKRTEGPSLSIVNNLDVLRQRMMLEMARRRMKESQVQIAANAEYLDKLGKRSVDSQLLSLTSLSYHRPNHQTQQVRNDQARRKRRYV